MSSRSKDPLISLPIELAAEILTEWVDVRSAVQTDSAYCHSTKRRTLLSIFGSPEFVLKSSFHNSAYNYSLNWKFKRNIRSTSLVAGSRCELAIFMKYVLKFGKRLKYIRFTQCNTENPTYISLAALHCPSITTLEFDDCSLRAFVGDVLTHNPKIQRPLPDHNTNSCEFTPTPIISLCRRLNCLKLVNCSKLTGIALVVLLEQCCNLHTLSLRNSPWLTDPTLVKVAHLCRQVQNLDISNCFRITDVGVGAAIMSLADLRVLDVSECNVTDSTLITIAANRADTITALHLSYCPRITAKYINVTLRCCKLLRSLSIDLYEQSLPQVVALDWPLLAHIATLRVSCTHLISDGLLPIALHCAQLQHLHVSFVTTEFSQELLCVLQYCAYLRTLVVHTKYASAVPLWRELRPDVYITHKTV